MKFKPIYIRLIKLIILICSVAFITYKFWNINELISENNFKPLIEAIDYGLFIIVLILMFFNWLIESIKWKIIVNSFQALTLKNSFISIINGIYCSIFLPNRTGEFVGRIMLIDKKNTSKAIYLSIVGNIAQLFNTIFFGGISLIALIIIFQNQQSYYTIYLSAIFAIILLFLYFNLNKISKILYKYKFVRNLFTNLNVFEKLKKSDLFIQLYLSTIRYLIFIIQFYLLILILEIDISFIESSIILSCTYITMIFMPYFTITEAGIRGAVILIFSKYYTDNNFEIILASTILWVINVSIPAIIGMFIQKKIKINELGK